MVENSVHRASHVIPQAHARSTVTLHQPLAGLPLALAREAGRLGERGSFEPNMGAARRGGGSLLVGRQTPHSCPARCWSLRPVVGPTGRAYSMSFCFLISDVVSAAIVPTSRETLSGL
jgi:hypothetical protein